MIDGVLYRRWLEMRLASIWLSDIKNREANPDTANIPRHLRAKVNRWRKEYGGMKADQLKRLKELVKENERLRRAVSDLTLDKQILAEAAKGNF